MSLVRFKLSRFVLEYASEFRKMKDEIHLLRERNTELERELNGYRDATQNEIHLLVD